MASADSHPHGPTAPGATRPTHECYQNDPPALPNDSAKHEWWKNNAADYDHPDREYIGTVRTTSHVMAVLHVHSVQDHMETPSREDHRLETQELLDGLCSVLAAVDGDEEFLMVLRELAQRGSGSSDVETHDDDPGGGASG